MRGLEHLRCAECGTLIRPDSQPGADNPVERGPWLEAERAKERTYRAGLEWLEALAPGRRLLDIGSGFGHFLRLASERGWEAHGLEASADAAMQARAAGLDVVTRRIEEMDASVGTFSAVTLWDVLDHLPDPVASLRRVRDLLDEGGGSSPGCRTPTSIS